MKTKHMVIVEAVFVIGVFFLVYLIYPKVSIEIDKNRVEFASINANLIRISENPDFSNSRYIEIGKGKNISFRLKPGTYYWKTDNGIVRSISKEFIIESEVGMSIERNDTNSTLANVGNVKINITKTKEGRMVGHIILEPDEESVIEDKGEKYVGRENE